MANLQVSHCLVLCQARSYKYQKEHISFFMSVRPFICLSAFISAVPTGRVFMKFDTRSFYGKLVEKLQIWLKPDKNFGYFA
jgi:hypothetical protein